MRILKTCLTALLALLCTAGFSQKRIDVGAEIWIEPGQSREDIDGWFRLAADNKMLSARLFLMWNYIETAPGKFDFTLYDYAFDAAERYGVTIEPTLCAIHGPVFYSGKFAGRPQFNELFTDRGVMAHAADYIRECVTRYRGRKALGCWWVLNEPRRFDATSPLATEFLREWAAAKYGSIEEVNRAWITDYDSFDDICYNPLWTTGDYFYWPVPCVDWYQVQRDFLTFNLRWIHDCIRLYDKTTPVTMNPANVFESAHQYDLPSYSDIFDIYGASMHASWQLRFLDREQYGYAVAGISDMLKAHAPGGRFWVSELQGGNNIFSGRTPMCPDSLDLAQWVWTGIGSGARKVIYWALNYRRQGIEAGEWGLFGFRGEETDRSRVTRAMNETLQSHADFFADSEPCPDNVTLLVSPETMRLLLHIQAHKAGEPLFNADAHVKSVMMWYVALSECGIRPQMSYLRAYPWEQRGKGDVVVLTSAIGVPDDVVERMEKFVERGGFLVCEGLSGLYDEYEVCTPQTGFSMERLLGGVFEDIRYRERENMFVLDGVGEVRGFRWKPVLRPTAETASPFGRGDEGVCALRNRIGSGEVVWIAPSVALSALDRNSTDELSALCESLLPEKSAPFGFAKRAPGMLMRVLCNGGRYVTVVTNNRKTEGRVRIEAPEGLVPNVIFGDAAVGRRGDVRLQGRGTVVILWENKL